MSASHFRFRLSPVRALALLGLLGVALPTGLARAQEPGSIIGRVLDEETGDSLPGALAKVKGKDPVTVGPSGRFEITGLEPGQIELTITHIGYTPRTLKFLLAAGQRLIRDYSMEFTGAKLPEIVVTARAVRLAPRYQEFEKRRERGLGAYFRWDDIKTKGFSTLGDALRTVRGVRMRCNQQTYECFAVMTRSSGCNPTWWIDGVEVNSFHENTPIRDVYGMEVYRGASEIPGDFGGSNAGCGVIVVWTKSKPFR